MVRIVCGSFVLSWLFMGCSVINSMDDKIIRNSPYEDVEWQDESPSGTYTWDDATTYCSNLQENDRKDWRLPTIDQLRSIIRGNDQTEWGGDCEVDDNCLDEDCSSVDCAGLSGEGGPGEDGCYWKEEFDGDCLWYWSSSEVEDEDDEAWVVYFYSSAIETGNKSDNKNVRCIRY